MTNPESGFAEYWSINPASQLPKIALTHTLQFRRTYVCVQNETAKERPYGQHIRGEVGGRMQGKPMLNSPVEVHSTAADEFVKRAISRLDEAHEAHQALKSILSELVNPDLEHIDRDKRRFSTLVNVFGRKTF